MSTTPDTISPDTYNPLGLEARIPGRFGTVLPRAAAGSQYILLGDTDHSDLGISGFVADPATMRALRDSGVTRLYLERPVELQTYADQLAAGTITRDDFIKIMGEKFDDFHLDAAQEKILNGQTADMILNAGRNGITVCFADQGQGMQTPPSPELSARLREFGDDFARMKGMTYSELDRQAAKDPALYREIREYSRSRVGELPPDLVREYQDRMLDRRLSDQQLADFISQDSQGQRSAVFYGASHGRGANDLDELLDGKSVRVDLYSDINRQNATKPGERLTDPAEIAYIVGPEAGGYVTHSATPELRNRLGVHANPESTAMHPATARQPQLAP